MRKALRASSISCLGKAPTQTCGSAMDGNEIAGISPAAPNPTMTLTGWINILGPPSWRKRGVGLALLQHSFGEFYRRGKRKVGLGVDVKPDWRIAAVREGRHARPSGF